MLSTSIDKTELLTRARKHCFFVGMNDSGAELCKVNTPYGLASIHYIQDKLGMKPNATFISSPDMTITRNVSRWRSGFGYGGKLTWGSGSDEMVILNIKPNACGMMVGGLEELPEIDGLIRKLHELEAGNYYIDDIKVDWDFYKSNHFVDIFEVKQVSAHPISLPKYAFVLHGSSGELRGDTSTGFGIYYDKSKKLREMAENIETPFGEFLILTGENARKYYERYLYAEDFAKRKKQLAAKLLFDEYIEIANETHQGMISMNEIILGCHHLTHYDKLYPVTLRADLPAYLVRGIPNYTPESIDILGFESRAKKLGVYEHLRNANILPHGGGYVMPDILGVNRVIEMNGHRYFEAEMQNDRGKQIISEVHELPYEYRGRTVVLRSLEIGAMEIIYKLIPKFVLKI